ncbi:hypothetical protein [Cellulomonas fimi]|uniref:Glycosyl transferase family 4 n=1 Tax=Cellulomonas fimi TaxID=1708 RepID=A0A7Y0M1N2_CELFI|nr:hypothetical protein [Cellulomonas fimi]NMR21418.1 hypothetical protein [Cellulomonas fimi]
MSVRAARRLAAAGAAVGGTRLLRGALGRAAADSRQPAQPAQPRRRAARLVGDADRWTRTNHRGEPVSMLEGPAAAGGLLVGAVVGATTARGAVAATVATGGAAVFGLVDDLTEDTLTRTKGLRGHLGALRGGTLTTGALKILGIGVSGLAAAAVATPLHGVDGARRAGAAWVGDVVVSGALIAAFANLVNLLDLRPGRALKAAALGAAPLALTSGPGSGIAAGLLGAAAASAGDDLAERDMLGDGGANALGALLGTAVVLGCPRPVRVALLAGAVALTVASERVSFTRVIATTPVLRELDDWGRRPADEAPADSGTSAR